MTASHSTCTPGGLWLSLCEFLVITEHPVLCSLLQLTDGTTDGKHIFVYCCAMTPYSYDYSDGINKFYCQWILPVWSIYWIYEYVLGIISRCIIYSYTADTASCTSGKLTVFTL